MNEIKETCKIKFRSCVVSNDTEGLIHSEKDIFITAADTKQCYSFDICSVTPKLSDIPLSAAECAESATLMAVLGFNSSVVINNVLDCNNEDSTAIENEIVELLIHKLILQLSSQKCGATAQNMIKFQVFFRCFEVVDSRVLDLLVDDLPMDRSVKANNSLKVRQQEKNLVYVDGLQSIDITTVESVAAVIRSATNRRTYLAAGSASGTVPPRVIGAVGNVFMQFTVHQIMSRLDSTATVMKESVLEVVSLAVSDTLNFKPVDGECMVCLQIAELGNFALLTSGNNNGSDSSAVVCNNKTATLLSECLKSLSTLTRVVQVLRSNTADSRAARTALSESANKTTFQMQQKHVPYRDSLLTRLLQRSLHGNCYMTMVTLISSRTENIARVLRFAAEIGGLYNRVHINARVLPLGKDGVVVAERSDAPLTNKHNNGSDDDDDSNAIDQVGYPLDNMADFSVTDNNSKFSSLLDAFQGDMSALSTELSRISADLFAATTTAFVYPKSLTQCNDEVKDTVMSTDALATDPSPITSGAAMNEFDDPAAADSQSLTETPAETDHNEIGCSIPALVERTIKSPEITYGVADANGEVSTLRAVSPRAVSKSVNRVRTEAESTKVQQTVASERMTSEITTPQPKQSDTASAGNNTRRKSTKVAISKGLPPVQQKSISSGSGKVAKLSSSASSSVLQRASTPDSTSMKPNSARVNSNECNLVNDIQPTKRKARASSSGVPTLPSLVSSSSSGKFPALQSASTSAAVLATPVVLTESRKTIIELGIFDSRRNTPLAVAADGDDSAAMVDSDTRSIPDKAFDGTGDKASILPPVRATHAVMVPPMVQLLTASDVKRVVYSDPNNESSAAIGGDAVTLSKGSTLSGTIIRSDGVTLSTPGSAARTVGGDAAATIARKQKPLSFLAESSSDDDDSDDRRINSDPRPDSLSIVSASAASVPLSPTPAVDRSTVEKEWSFVPHRRSALVENEDDSGGDDLSEPERRFLRACAASQVEAAEMCLVRQRVNVHVKNNFERDAMQICSRNGNVPMLTMLLSHGGLLSSRGPKGDTLFHLAAYNGHVEALKWLHGRGILPEAVDLLGQTAVHVAARRGELSVLRYLHDELSMDFGQLDFEGRLPIECVPRRGPIELEAVRQYLNSVEMRDALLRKGAVALSL